jgi:hypothetical protein
MPAELESAVRAARETAAREAEEAEQYKAAMLEREAATAEKAHQLRGASLQAAVDQNAARIAGLTAQLQAALQQAQTLALRAVEGANK